MKNEYDVKELSSDLQDAMGTLSELADLLDDLLAKKVTKIVINLDKYDYLNSETKLVVSAEPVKKNESEERKSGNAENG